jgi:hypothetical protein
VFFIIVSKERPNVKNKKTAHRAEIEIAKKEITLDELADHSNRQGLFL